LLAISEHLTGTLGERFTPAQLLRDKVGRGGAVFGRWVESDAAR